MTAGVARPIDRVHFLDAQRRNRRRALPFSAFALVAVAIAGIPLCVVVSPLLFGIVLVVAHAIDLVAALSPAQWDVLHDVAFIVPNLWAAVRGRPTDVPWGTVALLFVAPGAAAMVVAWPMIALMSRRAGAGTILRRLRGRDPDRTVLAEQQVSNVVQEIAVAAGVRPPAVRIIDSPAVNAVAIGLTTDDATILVTAGFLERLDRDERQAIVAHLVGSVGNGDLEIAAVILSVFQTWGLVALLLETPLDARRRRLVRRFVALSIDALRGRVDTEEARAMLDALLGGGAFEFEEFFANLDTIQPRSVLHACSIIVIQIPVIAVLGLATITAKQSITLFTNLILGPWLAAMWRARRLLADATAVQLTRNPEALARAVRDLDAMDVAVPGGWPVSFLFPVWVHVTDSHLAAHPDVATHIVGMRLEAPARLERLAALGAPREPHAYGRRASLGVRVRAALPSGRDLGLALTWGAVAVLSLAVLLAVTVTAASLLLIVLWYALRWVVTLARAVG